MSSHLAIVLAVVSLFCCAGVGQSPDAHQSGSNGAREFWNDKFRAGLPNVRREPSRLLVEAVARLAPGSALDLGCGDGRNLLYLAGRGWTVTGIDVSDVAVAQAEEAARARQLTAQVLVSDLDAYEFGENRWDLISSIYMQDWHLKSKTNTFLRMKKALKAGGVLVIEGFGPPNGMNLDAMKREFESWSVVRADVVADDPDWGKGRGNKQILRFVARKNTASLP